MKLHHIELPDPAKAGMMAGFGEFVARTSLDDIPAEILDYAKGSLLHNLACALMSRNNNEACDSLALEYYASPSEATLISSGQKASLPGTILANAALMHGRTQDDSHVPSSSHPGCLVLPAAMAVAEHRGASGGDFLTAAILGYEVLGRIGRAGKLLTVPRGFRGTPLYGPFGSATAIAKLMGYSPARIANSLTIAANLSGGLGITWVEGTEEWRFQAAMAGMNGLLATRVGVAISSATHFTLEGRAGFFEAFGGTAETPVAPFDNPDHWEFEDITLKRFPCCAMLQGQTSLLLEFVAEHPLPPDDIETVEITLSQFEAEYPGIDSTGPFASRGGTLMSAQFCAALVLVEHDFTTKGLDRIDDSRILDLARRVRVIGEKDRPRSNGKVAIHMKSGDVHRLQWDPSMMSPSKRFADVSAYVADMIGEVGIGGDIARELVDHVGALDKAPNVDRLLQTLLPRGDAAVQAVALA